MRSAEEFATVQELIASGLNDCAIARRTGIPRPTVWGWRRRPPLRSRNDSFAHDFADLPAAAYCYLLALYLGDGCISRHPRTWRLRIVLDIKYPGIIDRCREAIDTLMPAQRAAIQRRVKNCVEVSLYSKHWPCLFPQHGLGKKHHREIRLEPWREALVKQATEEFVRGLIDSDGCRVVANDRGVRSVRYHFSRTGPTISGACSAPHSTTSQSRGPGTAGMRSPSTAKRRPRGSTSSSARRPERYRQGVSTTRRRRPALVVLVIVAACGCLMLGWWQWTRFQSTAGTFQNLGYALQWPLFAWFCVYAYRKFVRYEEAPPDPHRGDTVTEIPAGLLPERPAHAPPSDDPVLAEYNAYLAELARNDKQNRNTA